MRFTWLAFTDEAGLPEASRCGLAKGPAQVFGRCLKLHRYAARHTIPTRAGGRNDPGSRKVRTLPWIVFLHQSRLTLEINNNIRQDQTCDLCFWQAVLRSVEGERYEGG